MLNFDVITLFPQLIEPHLNELPFKRAIEKQIIKVTVHHLRNYAIDKHGTVDDKPYGGGVGMILRPEPVYDALNDIYKNKSKENSLIVPLMPSGEVYTQEFAGKFTKLEQIALICGRYEGIDNRIIDFENLIGVRVMPISIGNYILSGGEVPALVIMESVTRILPGVIEKESATQIESFSKGSDIEYPQYTRPEDFMGLRVPEILLSGNHKQIEEWRTKHRK